jgi:hypothetical protein
LHALSHGNLPHLNIADINRLKHKASDNFSIDVASNVARICLDQQLLSREGEA